MERVKKFLVFWYYQYILHTGLYMLEIWERNIFSAFLIAVFAMASYTTYLYLPGHLAMLGRYLAYIVGAGDMHIQTRVTDSNFDEADATAYGGTGS